MGAAFGDAHAADDGLLTYELAAGDGRNLLAALGDLPDREILRADGEILMALRSGAARRRRVMPLVGSTGGIGVWRCSPAILTRPLLAVAYRDA